MLKIWCYFEVSGCFLGQKDDVRRGGSSFTLLLSVKCPFTSAVGLGPRGEYLSEQYCVIRMEEALLDVLRWSCAGAVPGEDYGDG